MIEALLKGIGVLYGIFGIINFFTFLLLFVYGPPLKSFPAKFSIEALGTPLLIAIISLMIMYSCFKRKKWGRYLVIVFNTVGLLEFGWGFNLSSPITASTIFYFVIIILLPAGVILFCFHPKVKELMQN